MVVHVEYEGVEADLLADLVDVVQLGGGTVMERRDTRGPDAAAYLGVEIVLPALKLVAAGLVGAVGREVWDGVKSLVTRLADRVVHARTVATGDGRSIEVRFRGQVVPLLADAIDQAIPALARAADEHNLGTIECRAADFHDGRWRVAHGVKRNGEPVVLRWDDGGFTPT